MMQSLQLPMQRGNALAETLVSLLALSPFLVGIPLLGKQLDIKQKTYDSARYSVWERTVWRSDGAANRKTEDDITLEARDRTLGSPLSGITASEDLRSQGITENELWRDRQRQRLLDYRDNDAPVQLTHDERPSPVPVGLFLVPGIAHGEGVLRHVQQALDLDNLKLSRRAFASATIAIGVRPVLGELADAHVTLGERTAAATTRRAQIVQRAGGAILSDTWTARDENALRRRVDDVTVNEFVERFELPSRLIALQALGPGQPMYGEGQFGWDPDLRPRTATLPAAYVEQR